MIVCKSCHGNCDHGELVQGICMECWEKEERGKARDALLKELEGSAFKQMSLDLEGMGNGKQYSHGTCRGI